MNFGQPGFYSLAFSKAGDHELTITRELVFGDHGVVNFPQDVYPQLKRAFDEIYGRDTRAVSLTESGGAQ